MNILRLMLRARRALAVSASSTIIYLSVAGSAAEAQAIRAVPLNPFRPQLNVLGSISVSATPALVSFNLVAGASATASAPIVIYTKATNIGLLTSLSLYGYFSSTAALTSAEGAAINSSDVWAISDAQPAYQSFTGNSPFASGTSVLIFRTSSLLDLGSQSGHQNTLTLKIDLSDAPKQPAGSYTGTLILQAQAL